MGVTLSTPQMLRPTTDKTAMFPGTAEVKPQSTNLQWDCNAWAPFSNHHPHSNMQPSHGTQWSCTKWALNTSHLFRIQVTRYSSVLWTNYGGNTTVLCITSGLEVKNSTQSKFFKTFLLLMKFWICGFISNRGIHILSEVCNSLS